MRCFFFFFKFFDYLIRIAFFLVGDNFMIFNDVNDTLRSQIILVVDGSNDTCLDLPVLGQIPPILWMRMNISGIWGLFSSSFRLHIIGKNINCDNQNDGSVFKVILSIKKTKVIL